jgi:hypothetical protein
MRSDDRVGGSSFRFEPPDLCIWTLVGDISAETVRALLDEQHRAVSGMPAVFSLVFASKVGSVSKEARKESTEVRPGINARGVAYIGASFPVRVLAILVTKANELLNRAVENPLRFFNTEAEARAWIEQRRAEVAAEAR